ncbi:hypothetical protein KQX54_021790 [Cotesia glomerata]|uniref:Secreted protein n=1 Tax=Cotesia glomerata TaxID=32391 RepID=A0AAV7JAE4_COTGL|nr:hypothetical protein KQX54_021790 [Cotesia glomerata]
MSSKHRRSEVLFIIFSFGARPVLGKGEECRVDGFVRGKWEREMSKELRSTARKGEKKGKRRHLRQESRVCKERCVHQSPLSPLKGNECLVERHPQSPLLGLFGLMKRSI